MILTEREAMDRWCPFARAWDSNDEGLAAAAVNRDSAGRFTGTANCIGSACMAWRPYDETRGYCGLSGAPPPWAAPPRAPTRKPSSDDRRLALAERELEAITAERGASKHE